MTVTPCVLCGSLVADQARACTHCTGQAARTLAEIIRLTPDARAVARGEIRRGGGEGHGKPGSRPPLNDGATDVMHAVQNALTTLAREIAETRGVPLDPDGPRARLRAPHSVQTGDPGRRDTPNAAQAISGGSA